MRRAALRKVNDDCDDVGGEGGDGHDDGGDDVGHYEDGERRETNCEKLLGA